MSFSTLSTADLERTTGGAAQTPAVCTPDNPTGARQPTQFLENARPQQPNREPPPTSYGNFFTNPRDLPGKAQALADRFR